MKYEFRVQHREPCYQGFFRLDRYRLQHTLFAGGWSKPIHRELLEKGHAAAALLYDPDRDAVVLIEQFRIGAIHEPQSPWLLELVAGFIEDGESAEDVVRRETLEESGCEVRDLIPIARYYVSPGGTSETIALFCAHVAAPESGEIHGLEEEGEDIRVRVLPVEEAWQWVEEGRIASATPLIGLQWLRLHHARVRARFAID